MMKVGIRVGRLQETFPPPYVRTFQHCQDCAGERGGFVRLTTFYALVTMERSVQTHRLTWCPLLCHSPSHKTKGEYIFHLQFQSIL